MSYIYTLDEFKKDIDFFKTQTTYFSTTDLTILKEDCIDLLPEVLFDFVYGEKGARTTEINLTDNARVLIKLYRKTDYYPLLDNQFPVREVFRIFFLSKGLESEREFMWGAKVYNSRHTRTEDKVLDYARLITNKGLLYKAVEYLTELVDYEKAFSKTFIKL